MAERAGEFFDIPLRQAVDLIDALLIELKAEVRERGVISAIFRDKGCGFMTSDDGSDPFFHANEVESGFIELCEGDAVEFDRIETSKGFADVRVRRTSSPG